MSLELAHAFDDDISVVKYNITTLLDEISAMTVHNEQSYKAVTSIYARARDWQKIIDAKRKEATAPARQIVSTINDRAKEFSEPLALIISIANEKVSNYSRVLESQRIAEVERLNDAARLLDLPADIRLPQVAPPRGNGATAYTSSKTSWEIVDRSKIPLKYFKIDEDLIERDIAMGLDSIQGIKIFKETKTQLRKR